MNFQCKNVEQNCTELKRSKMLRVESQKAHGSCMDNKSTKAIV